MLMINLRAMISGEGIEIKALAAALEPLSGRLDRVFYID
jgi:hypothetical protein